MTREEIIKALDCCRRDDSRGPDCPDCPLQNREPECVDTLLGAAHDLLTAPSEIAENPQVATEMSLPERVNHPQHYNAGGIECIDAMLSAFGAESVQTFCIINAFKYIWRCENKGQYLDDLKKARWYLDKAIELEVDHVAD